MSKEHGFKIGDKVMINIDLLETLDHASYESEFLYLGRKVTNSVNAGVIEYAKRAGAGPHTICDIDGGGLELVDVRFRFLPEWVTRVEEKNELTILKQTRELILRIRDAWDCVVSFSINQNGEISFFVGHRFHNLSDFEELETLIGAYNTILDVDHGVKSEGERLLSDVTDTEVYRNGQPLENVL